MAPRSPTHAFDPTPALERDRTNYSPLNDPFNMKSENLNHDSTAKEVRFSAAVAIPSRTRHSIATTDVPLLPSVISASQIPKQSFRMANPNQEIDITAYIENCRNLNEQLRHAHDTERRTWEIERTALQARIADLEFKLKKSRDSKRRLSNESSTAGVQSFRSDFRILHTTNPSGTSRSSSEPFVSAAPKTWKMMDSHQAPVWKGPETTPPATRVFTNEDDINHLPSISEDEPLRSLSRQISPTTVTVDRTGSLSIPIEQLDKSLDGITLKSSGLTSSFVAKVSSPNQGTSPVRSPSPRSKNGTAGAGNLQVKMNHLLSPMDEKLKRHAGHTPMAFDSNVSTENASTAVVTPKQEDPLAPVPSTRPPPRPSEVSDSYFSFVSGCMTAEEIQDKATSDEANAQQHHPRHHHFDGINENDEDEDPALKGPLILDPTAKSEAAQSFLEKVDAKLMEAAQHSQNDSPNNSDNNTNSSTTSSTSLSAEQGSAVMTNGHDTNQDKPQDSQHHASSIKGETEEKENHHHKEKDEEMPMLKIKNSMNFGSAWGGDMPGRI